MNTIKTIQEFASHAKWIDEMEKEKARLIKEERYEDNWGDGAYASGIVVGLIKRDNLDASTDYVLFTTGRIVYIHAAPGSSYSA